MPSGIIVNCAKDSRKSTSLRITEAQLCVECSFIRNKKYETPLKVKESKKKEVEF